MPRQKISPPLPEPEVTAPVAALASTPLPAPLPVVELPITLPDDLPAGPVMVSVGVRNRCPWATVQSASSSWGRAPTFIRADDPRLPELRACEWLTVT